MLQKKILADTLEKHIGGYFRKGERLLKERLVELIKGDFPYWSSNTINMYLSKLKKEGIISSISRGIYELGNGTPIFRPKISRNLKSIYKNIKGEFPYISFCVWDSVWLNDLMRHQPFKHYLVIEVEKDASESVFALLTESLKTVFLNPTKKTFDRYIHNADDAVILKNLVSEAPLMEIEHIVSPALEKLLVDMLIDVELFAAQQNETENIMKNAMDRYLINELKMRRYAIRRNRESEIENLINITLAKY